MPAAIFNGLKTHDRVDAFVLLHAVPIPYHRIGFVMWRLYAVFPQYTLSGEDPGSMSNEPWIISRPTCAYIVQLRTARGAENIHHVVFLDAKRNFLYSSCESRVMYHTWDVLALSVDVPNASGGERLS